MAISETGEKQQEKFFGKSFATQAYSYDFAIYKAIKSKKATLSKASLRVSLYFRKS